MRDEAEVMTEFQQNVLRKVEESIEKRKEPNYDCDGWRIGFPYDKEVALQRQVENIPDLVRRLRMCEFVPEQVMHQLEELADEHRISEEDAERHKKIYYDGHEYLRILTNHLGRAFDRLCFWQQNLSKKSQEMNSRAAIKEIREIASKPMLSGQDLTDRLKELEIVFDDYLFEAM